MGLLEKASQIIEKKQTPLSVPITDTSGVGLFKRSLAYTAPQAADKKKSLTANTQIQYNDPANLPLLLRPFFCFEQFTAANNCQRCLIVGFAPGVEKTEDDLPCVLFCKGFDFTTETRCMIPYYILTSITKNHAEVFISDTKEFEFIKGYISSTEFRALRELFIARMEATDTWFIAANSTLDTTLPDFSSMKQSISSLTQQLVKNGLPSAQFISAANTINSESQTTVLIDTALSQKKQGLLLHLSIEQLLTSWSQLLPQNYSRAVFLEIAANIKKAAGDGNILNCIAPDNIRAVIFTTHMTDPDLYVFQLNKMLASCTGTNTSVSIINSKLSTEKTEINEFFA